MHVLASAKVFDLFEEISTYACLYVYMCMCIYINFVILYIYTHGYVHIYLKYINKTALGSLMFVREFRRAVSIVHA